MNSSTKNLLKTFQGKKTDSIPFWFMRQAGRYLPEYRELRARNKNFLDFCYNPAMASEVTLQPIHRFGMSAAIIFSDILVVPHALGADVRFEENHGPILTPIINDKSLDTLNADSLAKKLEPVYEALRMTHAALPADTALIGFVGAPWTLACYMIEGQGKRDFKSVCAFAAAHPEFFKRMMVLLTEAVARHAVEQIKAGAEVIQIFDSWAGVLNDQEFSQWSIEPTKQIVNSIKAQFPDVPVIGFPRQAGTKSLAYAKKTGVDGVSIDGSVSLEWAKKELCDVCVVQGNLDPILLADDKTSMLKEAKKILDKLGDKSFVFNLGHGILPHTPIENVQALCDLIKNHS